MVKIEHFASSQAQLDAVNFRQDVNNIVFCEKVERLTKLNKSLSMYWSPKNCRIGLPISRCDIVFKDKNKDGKVAVLN